jgi:hypothetical protein
MVIDKGNLLGYKSMISSMDAEYGGGVWKLGMAMEHDDRDSD